MRCPDVSVIKIERHTKRLNPSIRLWHMWKDEVHSVFAKVTPHCQTFAILTFLRRGSCLPSNHRNGDGRTTLEMKRAAGLRGPPDGARFPQLPRFSEPAFLHHPCALKMTEKLRNVLPTWGSPSKCSPSLLPSPGPSHGMVACCPSFPSPPHHTDDIVPAPEDSPPLHRSCRLPGPPSAHRLGSESAEFEVRALQSGLWDSCGCVRSVSSWRLSRRKYKPTPQQEVGKRFGLLWEFWDISKLLYPT